MAVTGSTGFIGSAVSDRLVASGVDVVRVRAPRLAIELDDVDDLVAAATSSEHVEGLADQLVGVDAVVNAAGIADATARSSADLTGANGLLPRVVREAC